LRTDQLAAQQREVTVGAFHRAMLPAARDSPQM